jgi:hypothetical protein
MKIFQFGRHRIPFADVHDINVEYRYQDNEMFVDLEIQGGAQLSLNLPDSLEFMEQFITKIRHVKNLPEKAHGRLNLPTKGEAAEVKSQPLQTQFKSNGFYKCINFGLCGITMNAES